MFFYTQRDMPVRGRYTARLSCASDETRAAMDVVKPPMRWLRSYWDEEDVTYFFEADEDGWVLRQVELRGPDMMPAVAAAFAECPRADRDGLAAVQAYEAKYGMTAESPITQWDEGFPHVEIERTEFEAVWQRARAHLEGVR